MKFLFATAPLFVATALVLSQAASQAQGSHFVSRDPWLWPFSASSPWNKPIGSGASFRAANLGDAYSLSSDDELLNKTYARDPSRILFEMGNWYDRDSGTTDTGKRLNLRDDFIVPDAYQRADGSRHTPNNCSAFLRPDGVTVLHVAPLTRPTNAGNVWGFPGPPGFYKPEISILGDGLGAGAHQSELSALGGSLRQGELFGATNIRHALKINLWARRYYYYGSSESDGKSGYRWPATGCDFYANDPNSSNRYQGTNSSLQMGSLLAIPASITQTSLALETAPARKLFWTLQNYGAYIVDDSAWDSHALVMQDSAVPEFRAQMGYELYSTSDAPTAFYRDMMKIFKALSVVDNNSANAIGGGGTASQSAPPPLNLAFNYGLEEDGTFTQTPLGWSEWSDNGGETASYVETGGGKSGTARGTHWKATAYNIYTSQTRYDLANGLYTLSAWVKSSGGQNSCYLEAKDFGGTAKRANISASGGYVKVQIKDISVSNGTCTLAFWSSGSGGQWMNFDDIEFYRQ